MTVMFEGQRAPEKRLIVEVVGKFITSKVSY